MKKCCKCFEDKPSTEFKKVKRSIDGYSNSCKECGKKLTVDRSDNKADEHPTSVKTCFKCNHIKTLTDFYRHSRMADGRLNKCKECNKKDTTNDYWSNRQKHAKYEQKRFKDPVRKAKVKIYVQKSNQRNPEKRRARNAVSNAVRDGRLVPTPCVRCGSNEVQGHHVDYMKSLDVVWMCFACHRADHGQSVMNPTPSVRVLNQNN